MKSLWRLRRYILQRPKTLAIAYLCMVLLALSSASLATLCGPALQLVFAPEAAEAPVPALLKLERWLGLMARSSPWPVAAASAEHVLRALQRLARGVWLVPALIVAVAASKALAQAGQFYAMGRISLHVQACLRREAFAALLARPPAFFVHHRHGDLLSRLLGDTALIEQGIFYGLGSIVRDVLALGVLLGFCFAADAKLAAWTLLSVPLCAAPLLQFSRALKNFVRRSQAAQGEVANRCHEALAGLREVQACQREGHEAQLLAQAEQQRLQQMQRSYAVRAVRTPTMEILGALALAALLGLLGQQVRRQGADAAHYVSFLAALLMMYDPIKKLGNVADYLAQTEAAHDRLRQLLEAPQWVRERPGARILGQGGRGDGALVFANVGFGYGARRVLDGLSLTIPRGAQVAVVGESGAGKSTLAQLLPRFWDPQQGAILFDGHDLRDYTLSSLRAQLALVQQDSFLFAASAADNIGYGRPGAGRAEVVAAAKAAHAHAFIAALPQGYDTFLGERGARLSGGQKQRLALARALLRDAPVLILDEATSSLDADSEAQVQATMAQLLRHRTSLVIAHRLQTVREADFIVVLERGRVAEQGSHARLLRRDGAYARLWRLAEAAPQRATVAARGEAAGPAPWHDRSGAAPGACHGEAGAAGLPP